jgi:transcription-repair coupling factor (superfamily II helicase)
MGLSQLHQIRGRVGRSERQAYAYFTYKKYKALSDVARRRLEAIRDFASFGAGFKIALRDLEIRGAGNLLGAEQHGYIESVGYDLYIKLLSDAVLEERGEGVKEAFDASVDIKVSAHIPERYIALSAQRMEMYKKISLIENYDDMQDILDEFIDRFGEPPRETLSLLKISLIRALAARARISKTELREGAVTFHQAPPNLAAWSVVFGEFPGMAFRNTAHGAVVWYRITKGDNLDTIINILMEYNGGNNE